MARLDLAVVCVDSTRGWSEGADALTAALRRVGAQAEVVHAGRPPRVRTYALTDLVEARMARRAAERALAELHPKALVYCSVTSSLLWPAPGAIVLDSIAHANRPGRHGLWQRPVERRRLAQAPLLMALSERSLDALPDRRPAAVLCPPAVLDSSEAPPPESRRDLAAVTYAGNPVKRRLDRVLAAWEAARRPGETLVVAGLNGFDPPPGVSSAGVLPRRAFRDLLRRARVFVAAPAWEDHGIAALEALAAGCRLVTTPSPGPYPAREIARALDPRLVGEELSTAIRLALDVPDPSYAARAAERLTPYTTDSLDRTLSEVVLPRLLPGWRTLAAADLVR